MKIYIETLLRRWRIVVVTVLVCVLAGALYGLVRPPTYSSDLTFYVAAQNADTASAAYQAGLLSQQRVKSYVDLATGNRILEGVIQELGLTDTVDELRSRISVNSPADSVLLQISVQTTDPVLSTNIANSIGRQLPTLVAELERPTTPQGTPTVALRLVQPAMVPTDSDSRSPLTLAALGLLAGVVAGAGLALAREQLDLTIRTVGQLDRFSPRALLGVIPFDKKIAVGNDDIENLNTGVYSRRLEAARQVRTNLQFSNVDNPPKVILITSPSAGDGKSTLSVDLATMFAAAGEQVLLIDGDLRRPTVADRLGGDSSVGLTSILTKRTSLDLAVQRSHDRGFLYVSSGLLPPNPAELLASQNMRDVLAEARTKFSKVFIDAPPTLPVADASSLASAADLVIMVTRAERTKTNQVTNALDSIERVSASDAALVLVGTPEPTRASSYYYNAYKYSSQSVGFSGNGDGANGSERISVGSSGIVQAPNTRQSSPSPNRRARRDVTGSGS